MTFKIMSPEDESSMKKDRRLIAYELPYHHSSTSGCPPCRDISRASRGRWGWRRPDNYRQT